MKSLNHTYERWDPHYRSLSSYLPDHYDDGDLTDLPSIPCCRALVSMHKMPRVWLDYLDLLVEQKHITGSRRAFDRALAALPITQHDRVWTLYLV